MSAIADVKVSGIVDFSLPLRTNSATVATDRILNPVGFLPNNPGVCKWEDRTSGISLGFPYFTLSVKSPTKGSRMHKVQIRYYIPILEVTYPSTSTGIAPSPTLAYTNSCTIEFMTHERSTNVERLALFNNVLSLLVTQIAANDAAPIDQTGSPVYNAVIYHDSPY